MAPRLVAEKGKLKGLTLSLDDGNQWVIGSDPDACQLLIEDPLTAPKHLICRKSPEGIVAENLSKKTPTVVNNEAITSPHLLKNGDAVTIGGGTFIFYAGEDTDESPEPADEAPVKESPKKKAPKKKPTEKEAPEETTDEEPAEETTDEEPAEETTDEEPADEAPVKESPEEEVPEEASKEKPTEKEAPEETTDEETPEHDTLYTEETEEDKGILAEIDFDLRDTGRWLLKVIGGPNNGAEFSMLPGNSYVIGTDPTTCEVVFHDTSVSRQHARITISNDDTLTIEDLKSRNNTLIDGETLEGKQPLEPNSLVSMGTTSFLIFDREGDMQTIISPLLPSIVKVLQKEKETVDEEETPEEEATTPGTAPIAAEPTQSAMGAFILIGIITGLFVVVGFGMVTLFRPAPVQIKEKVDYVTLLNNALSPFKDVKYTFNDTTGGLFLSGHVLTLSEKKQLLYNLQGLEFIKQLDDNLVIDEFTTREINQILNRDPRWQGVSIHSPTAGTFVLSGYLQTRKEAKALSDYVTTHFNYPNQLQHRVIVEEDVLSTVNIELDQAGIKTLKVQLSNGEITLTGGLTKEQMVTIDRLARQFREIPGVRNVKTFVHQVATEQAMVNVTERYQVTGSSQQGGANVNVVVDGRILSRGDTLDGMTITSIRPTVIFLEKKGTKYRIDYNR